VIHPAWSIECKLLSRPSFSAMLEAAKQAERNVENDHQMPIAIIKRKNDHDLNALVVMRLETYRDWHLPSAEVSDEAPAPSPTARPRGFVSYR
jgi:hypothetical protein